MLTYSANEGVSYATSSADRRTHSDSQAYPLFKPNLINPLIKPPCTLTVVDITYIYTVWCLQVCLQTMKMQLIHYVIHSKNLFLYYLFTIATLV